MGANHMAEQLRGWSPGQAMLPPDPGGLNRALDRGAAAEHLRAVAPHLAPCLSCQAGLCAEHGPTVTATTTGALTCGHPRACRYVTGAGYVRCHGCDTSAPAPPQPEPRTAVGAWRCDVPRPHQWASEPTEDGERFCVVCYHVTGPHDAHVPPAPAAAATGELSREALESSLTMLRDCEIPYETATRMVTDLFHHDAALRTRAREAEEQTERTVREWDVLWTAACRERDEAREQRDAADARLPKEMPGCTILFKSCPLGHGRLVGANWTDTGCPWCHLAAATARAEEAERSAATDRTKKDAAYRDYLAERAARVAAEAEVKRLQRDLVAAQDAHTRAVLGLTERARCYDPAHAALRERCKALEEAGDEMDGCRDDLRQRCTSCHNKWAAAKAQVKP